MSLQLRAQAELERRKRVEQEEPWPAEHVPDPSGNPVPFHVGQQAVWKSTRRVTLMLAGTQSGKTQFGPLWLAREIYGDTVGNVQLSSTPFEGRGAGDYIAATATYDLFKLKMLPALRELFENTLSRGRYWSGDRVLELADPEGNFQAKRSTDPMWGRIILRSADSSGGLESATAKGALLDEAGQDRFELDSWSAVKRRLAIAQGRVLITTTPYNLGWIKQDIHDVAKDGVTPTTTEHDTHAPGFNAEMTVTDHPGRAFTDICMVQFDSILNPIYPVDEFISAKETMPDDEFLMFWRGLFTTLRTLIYDCFKPDIHVIDPFDIPPEWPRYVGIDPLGEKIAAIWLAYNPRNKTYYAYREYVEPFGVTTTQHAGNVLKLSSGERVLEWVGGGPSERQQRTNWTGAGVPLKASPVTDVWVGINSVYELFKTNRLFLFRGQLPYLQNELGIYQRQKDRVGDPTMKIKDKEKFHCCDSVRYIISYRERGGFWARGMAE